MRIKWAWLCGMALVLCLRGGELPEYLQRFRERVELCAGSGIGRSAEQVWEEGRGNCDELTNAFHAFLQAHGIPSEFCSGRIALSEEQRSFWGTAFPLPERFPWLRVGDMLLPDFGMRAPRRSPLDASEGNLFPCLTGRAELAETATLSAEDIVSLRRVARKTQISGEELVWFPAEELASLWEGCCLTAMTNWPKEEEMTTRKTGFPGYDCLWWLTSSPLCVETEEREELPRAFLRITLCTEDAEILRLRVPQQSICGDAGATLDYVWDEDGLPLKQGDEVLLRKIVPVWRMGDEETHGVTFPFGTTVECQIVREVAGMVTDCIAFPLTTGASVRFLASTGSSRMGEEGFALANVDRMCRQFCLAGEIVPTESLHLALRMRDWKTTRFAGMPRRLEEEEEHWMIPAWGGEWRGNATKANLCGMGRALIPFLLASGETLTEWLDGFSHENGMGIRVLEDGFHLERDGKPIQTFQRGANGSWKLFHWNDGEIQETNAYGEMASVRHVPMGMAVAFRALFDALAEEELASFYCLCCLAEWLPAMSLSAPSEEPHEKEPFPVWEEPEELVRDDRIHLSISGLRGENALLGGEREVFVYAPGAEKVRILCNGKEIASADGMSLVADITPERWKDGRYSILAIAEAGGDSWESSPVSFLYSRYAVTENAEVRIEAEAWPPWEGDVHIIAEEGSLLKLYLDGELLTEGRTHVEMGVLTQEDWNKGLLLTIRDANGMEVRKELKVPLFAEGQGDFQLTFVAEDFAREVLVVGTEALLCVELDLNGETVARIPFLGEESVLITIPEERLLEGHNVLCARAWNGTGEEQDSVAEFVVPILEDCRVEPGQVRPWAGTAEEISVSAQMRAEHTWRVEMVDADGNVHDSMRGVGTEVIATLAPKGLTDGMYQVRIVVEDCGVVEAFPVEWDAIAGSPMAELHSPAEEALVKDGVFSVVGTACNTEADEEAEWTLQLLDASGVCQREIQGSDRRQGEPLATLDLTDLPNGRYGLRLEVVSNGQCARAERSFTLDSKLKLGEFCFQEEDFVAYAGSLPMHFVRRYSSFEEGDCGYGIGWKGTLSCAEPELDEERREMVDVEGHPCSVRSGGGRNITVTLTNGQRVTFVYALVAGGSLSFASSARWNAPAGIGATLTPTCSSRLMTLPGLQPYWEAAGMDVPMEQFDFPGFTVTEADGTMMHLVRENLGTHFLLAGGESIALDLYGELRLGEIEFPDGRRVEFGKESVMGWDTDGKGSPVVEFTRNENGRISSIHVLGELETNIRYIYDERGNLVFCERSSDGENWRVFREYAYGKSEFPHHITEILREDGVSLLTVGYDADGRRTAIGRGENADGWECNAMAGVEVKRDALGRETVVRFDQTGRILSEVRPNGRTVHYSYDDSGNETAVWDDDGYEEKREYDSHGRMTAIVFPAGGRREYAYHGDLCTQIRDEAGRAYHFGYDANEKMAEFQTPGGRVYGYHRDDKGRTVSLTRDGRELQWMQYDANGFLTLLGTASGMLLEQKVHSFAKPQWRRFAFFDPISGKEEELVQEYTYDAQGREIRIDGSDGRWLEREYGANGRVKRVAESDGTTAEFWYDVEDRVVQRRVGDSITRYGYDGIGRLLFCGEATVPAGMDAPEELKCDGSWWKLDPQERWRRETHASEMCIALVDCGGGCWKTELRSPGMGMSEAREEYDRRGCLTKRVSPEGRERKFTTDMAGNVVTITETGEEMHMTYHPDGRLAVTEYPDGGVERKLYDERGFESGIVFADGNRVEYEMDRDGHLVLERDGLGREKHFLRDEDGLLVQVEEGGTTWSYDYDEVMELSKVTDPMGRETQLVRDGMGRQVLCQTPLGNVWEYRYAQQNYQPSERISPEGCRVWTEFDAMGRRVREQEFWGDELFAEREWHYDNNGLLTRELAKSQGKIIEQVDFAYETGTGHVAMRKTNDSIVQLAYDDDGILTERTEEVWGWKRQESNANREHLFTVSSSRGIAGKRELAEKRDFRGKRLWVRRPDGSREETERDLCGRPLRIREVDSAGVERSSICYAYGKNGEILEEHLTGDAGEESRFFQYDALGRLQSVRHQTATGSWTEMTAFDECGNRILSEKRNTRREFSYDEEDRLVEERQGERKRIFRWNADGEFCGAYWEGENAERITCSWASNGRMHSVRREFPDGSEAVVAYLYGAEGQLCADEVKLLCSSGQEERFQRRYSYHAGELVEVVVFDGTEELVRWRRDGTCGSGVWESRKKGPFAFRKTLCDVRGTLLCSGKERGVFGESPSLESADGLNAESGFWGYTGAWEDGISGFVYLNARFYAPEWAIFLSRDPMGFDQTRPQTWNRYAYCGGDPINCTDPSGCLFITSLLNWGVATIRFVNEGLASFLTVPEAEAAYWMDEVFLSTPKRANNATIVVHGVGVHAMKYASDFIKLLSGGIRTYGKQNQDFYEFLWSGFSLFGNLPMMVPNRLQHEMALQSLINCHGILMARGYLRQNVLSHSWGTVMSKDAFESAVVFPQFWVTMGSPLPAPHHNCFPHFQYLQWLNYAYWNDPVVYLGMEGPLAPMHLVQKGALYEAEMPHLSQKMMSTMSPWSHSLYWEDSRVTDEIAWKLAYQLE